MNKMAIYLKGSQKPVIISDNKKGQLAENIERIEQIFASDNICKISTDTDCWIGRPTEVQGVLITSPIDVKPVTTPEVTNV
jgi:hypothetical protein